MILSSIAMISMGSDPEPAPSAEPVGPEPQWDWNPWTSFNGTTVYHSFSEMETELFWIADNYPQITKLVSIGKSWQGRDIWAMKVSDNPHVEEEGEPEVYFNSNHHAREWLTIENALYFLRYLTNFYGSNATVTNIVDSRQIWVIPTANPDGRVYDSAGDDPASHARQPYGWRKNTRDNDNSGTFTEAADGVDPNRNYGYLWGSSGATSDPTQDVYGGPYPFSEPETAAIRDFCRQHDFVFAISFHTYSQLILYPWGWSYENAPDHYALKAVAEAMAGVITNKAGSAYPGYTPQKSSGLYPTAGSDDDWLYGELGIFAYCIEMYPNVNDADAAVTGSYDLFHPRSDKVIPACQDNLPAMMLLCNLADNRNQLIDHVDVSPETAQVTVNRGTSKNVVLNITDDGRRADSFTISRTAVSGWTVGINPASMSLAKGQTSPATLSITVPAGATPGLYKIWVNATSTSNSSCRDSGIVQVNVPYPDDVSPITLEPFTELGDFPKGQYRIDSLVKNVGEIAVPGFNTQLTIKQLGVGSTVTLFSDNIEAALTNQWTIVDHDTTYSNSVWQRSTAQRHGGTYSAWCGSGTVYTSNAIQSLQMTQPISLERYNSATLQFWSYYNTEGAWDFCMVEGSGDNGQSWDYITRYTGTATSWQLRTLDLSPFLGAEQFKLRFRFTSDSNTEAAGFYLDDLTITANDPTEAIVYGPAPLAVPPLAVGASQELSWTYNFNTAGTFLAEVQTLHGTDGNAANNLRDVMFYINNSRTLPEFEGIQSVTNPGMGQTLELSWDAGLQVNDPLTYRVYRFDHAPSAAEVDSATPIYTGTALEYSDSSVVLGQTYYYVVRAQDALGQAEYNALSISGSAGISVDQYGVGSATAVYNYVGVTQATNNHYAYFNDMDDASQAELNTPNSRTEFTDTYYTNAATSNNVRAGPSANPGSGDEIGAEYRFTIAESQTAVTRIDITHEAQYSAATTVTLYALTDSGTWAAVGGGESFSSSIEKTMTRSITSNAANYISASNVLRFVFYASTSACTVSVDYAEAKIYTPVYSQDDNTVNWTSAGEDVAYYNIYRSDSQFGTYTLIGTAQAGALTYTDPGKGQADTTYWWYIVRAVDGYGAEETNSNAVQEPGEGDLEYAIPLVGKSSGTWVFVSYPVTVSGHIETVLNDSANGDGGTNWDRAYTWDNQYKKWLKYRKGGTDNTFTNVTNYMGLWLHLTSNGADQALSVPDTGAYPGVVVINLYTGWNLIGYPTMTSRAESATLPPSADMVSVWQASSPYISDHVKGSSMMSHGNGYWVHVTFDCTWTIQP